MLSRFEGENMSLLQMLNPTSCSVEIKNGIYMDNRTSLFGISKKQINIPLRNGIISGIMNYGRNAIIDYLLYDAVNSNVPVFFIRNRVNGQNSCNFACELENGAGGARCAVIDLDKGIGSINLFKGMGLESLKEIIINALKIYGYNDSEMEDFTYDWLSHIFNALKLGVPKDKFSLTKLYQYDKKWLNDRFKSALNNRVIPLEKYNEYIDDIDDLVKRYSVQLRRFKTFSKKINNSNLASMLSGTLTLADIYNNNMAILINLSEGNLQTESAVLLEMLIKRLNIETVKNNKSVTILFEDCNLKESPKEFINLLKATCNKYGSHVYFTEEKMTWWSDKDVAGHPASYCNAFFVLKQADPNEIKYCASLSGATKKIEQSKNYAPLASVYRLPPDSLVTLFYGNKLVGAGYAEKEVDTYNVEEQEISSLKSNESEVILISDSGIYNCKVVL